MKKKLGIVHKGGCNGKFDRDYFSELFKADFDVSFFPWDGVKNNRLISGRFGATLTNRLNDFDLIFLNSLGPIEGFRAPVFDFFNGLGRLDTTVVNDPETMIANFDKAYLIRLQQQGIPVVPSMEVGHFSYDQLRDSLDLGDTVLKPRVFGERSVGVIMAGDIKSERDWLKYLGNAQDCVLAQPFVQKIEQGERSFIYVGSDYSHGVFRDRKGDWRAGRVSNYKVIAPSSYEREVCKAVLDNWPSPYHLTRFDFIGGDKSLISEVEMINPGIWLSQEGVCESFGPLFSSYLRNLVDA